MATWPVVAASLGSAAAFAVATTLKHRSASQTPDAQQLRPREIGRLVGASIAHPLWLGGTLADTVGLSLQVLALHLGALVVVQPLLITGLLFALPLHHVLSGRRISRAELGWATLVAAALAAFLVLAGGAGKHPAQAPADHAPALVAAGVGVVLASLCVALARRQREAVSAALLGVAVGTCYAATAALLKAVTGLALRGTPALVSHWQVYALIVVGAAGLVLNQIAFQAGPLNASLPAIASVDPLLSIAVGAFVYDEHVRHGAASGAGLTVILLILGIAVVRLTRLENAPGPSTS